MGKRRNRNKKNKVFNNALDAKNLNASSASEVKELESCKVLPSQPIQKKESNLRDASCSKMLFVESCVDAKHDSKASNKLLTKDSSENSYASVYFPLNNLSIEKESEKLNKSAFENERQARIDCACAVRPKCKVLNTNSLHQTKIPSNKFPWEDSFEGYSGYSSSEENYFECPDQFERKRNEQPSNLGRLKIKESFISKVHQYKDCKALFLVTFRRWLPRRKNTLEKLRSLYRQVHDDALKYNQSQAALKEFSYNSRALKQGTDNQALDFLTSLSAFVSDAVSGIASFAEAVNVDSYQVKFQEIMDCDAEMTKDLYAARSQCIARYHGVEEVMREFHSDTLSSTVCKISTTLEVDKHWEVMKNAYQRDDMKTLLNEVNYFFNNASRADVLGKVGDSLQRYAADNPAVLDACKSTGKAVYGAFNAFGEKNNRNRLLENANSLANSYLMMDDKQEVERLNTIIREDTYQNKLELRIENAIESLELEMEEMNDLYLQMSNDDSY